MLVYNKSASIQLAGVAPEVNLRITQARKLTKGIYPGFETQGRRHQKSKTRVTSVALRKGFMSSNFFFKKAHLQNQFAHNIFVFMLHVKFRVAVAVNDETSSWTKNTICFFVKIFYWFKPVGGQGTQDHLCASTLRWKVIETRDSESK